MVRKSGEDAKERVLKEHGTLNPEPDKVEDERFRADDFFDPRDLVQVKYEMLRQVQGVTGLLPKRPGPRKAHKLTDEVMEFVRHLRAEEPVLSAEGLAGRLKGHYGLSVHPRSIERALARREKKHRGSR